MVPVLFALGFGAAAHAGQIAMGFMSYDEGTSAPTIATFDIQNLTGSNSFPPDAPVSTSVSFNNLSLTVHFLDGTSTSFGQSDFTLGLDGLSYNGPGVVFGSGNDAVSALLTGTFSTTSLTLADGTTPTILDTFSAAITDPTGGTLQNLDSAVIYATTTGGGTSVPEPRTLGLFMVSLLMAGLALARGRYRHGLLAAAFVLLGVASTSAEAASTTVQIATATLPSTGLTGVSQVNLSFRGMPAGATPAGMQMYLASGSCMAPGGATTAPNLIKMVFGGIGEVNFTIPAGLAAGTYYVSFSGTTTGGVSYVSNGCAILAVTTTNSTVAACVPTSSLAVAMGTTVTAYVPNGNWGSYATGVRAVPIEGGGSPVAIATPKAVNSCASNPANGETVCTANTPDVYLIKGDSLVGTLTSSANGYASFTGGSCQNCGVAINALTNTAYIAGGFSAASSGTGVQPLNLVNNIFGAPFLMTHQVSEDIAIDGTRNVLLSPGEDGSYTLLTLNSAGGIVSEFGNNAPAYYDLDSAAEDCTTGIALAAEEFSSNVYIVDLSQAAYTPALPAGTWTAPGNTVNVGAGGYFSAGTSGISVAPGTGHLGIVTGEFGGNTATVFQLPSTAGTGTPGLVDFAYFTLPSTPDGTYFSAGNDPHTTTAYTSPNNGKAYGVIADWATGAPAYLAIIDLKALLAAPRSSANFVDPSYDLVANGVIRYVPTN
ncbi:uncharacterized protein E1O_16340 [Burkholderiales bacterium GJ-E10]|nr:uncharacterized protein E1O_16340 [Burkholderiales bacterium GJ-E10]